VEARGGAGVDLTSLHSWAFLTKHADVLLALAREPELRIPEIAAAAGITERSAYRILADLEKAGYVRRRKEGRRNRYELRIGLPLGDPVAEDGLLADLLGVIEGSKPRTDGRWRGGHT
jgi:DNA-binding transcriptional ArsR family regulator